MKVLLKAVYDVLPSPSNLYTWNLSESPNCPLCSKPANLKHILSGCLIALQQGRYRWMHDQTLAVIPHHLQMALDMQNKKKPRVTYTNFVKSCQKALRQEAPGLIECANDWKMLVDLHKKIESPPDVIETRLRPDIFITSRHIRSFCLN